MLQSKTATLENMNQHHLAQIAGLLARLVECRLLTRREAEISLQRMAMENELSSVYF